MNNKQKLLFLMFGIILIMFLTNCNVEQPEPATVGELAYDVNKANGYTIHIKEDEQYVPYLVLTNNYNGNTLLLREEIMEQECQFSKSDDDDNDYYADSHVDSYLNSEFYDYFSDSMKDTIVNSTIQISKEYPDIFEIEGIERRIFLLSCTEVNIDLGITIEEGMPLKYFAEKKHMLCQRDGSYAGWWLRSNYLPERSMVWCISSEGVIGGSGVQYPNGIRPAFCVPSSIEIAREQVSSEIEGYVLKIEE